MFILYLFFNLAFVMIANRISPGITITDYEGVVNIGGDFFLSFIIGLLNTLIVPFCLVLNIVPTVKKIIIFSSIVSFGSYIFLSLLNYGIKVDAFYGVIIAGLIVTCGSTITGVIYKNKFIS